MSWMIFSALFNTSYVVARLLPVTALTFIMHTPWSSLGTSPLGKPEAKNNMPTKATASAPKLTT